MTTGIYKSLRRDIGRKVETKDAQGKVNGWTTVPDGHEVADIEVHIDMDGIARRLGLRAMKNKSGKASIAWGLVKVKAVRKKRIAQ